MRDPTKEWQMKYTKMDEFLRPGARFVLIVLVALLALGGSINAEETLKLTILHMNDPHAHYLAHDGKESTGPIGGFHRAATVIKDTLKQSRSEGRKTLVLLAGDLLTGSPYSRQYKGRLGVKLLNTMGFSAMVVGNHEFDHGKDNLLQKLRPQMAFRLLSANITDESGHYLFERATEEKVGPSNTRIVIFGLTTETTPDISSPGNVDGLFFQDSVETAKGFLKAYSHDDVVIALTHIGITRDRELALAFPKIDVIVGGHTHTLLQKPERPGQSGPIIVQAGADAKWVGLLNVDLQNGSVVNYDGRLIDLDSKVLADPKIAAIIAEHPLPPKWSEKIAETRVFLDGNRTAGGSAALNSLGRLISYLMAEEAGAEAAFTNQGGIRNSISVGKITLGDIDMALPYPNKLVKLILTGEDLLAVLQRSHDNDPYSGGKLLTYGLDYHIAGGKVKIDRVARKPFDPRQNYSIATNDFLAAGKDGYEILRDRAQDVHRYTTAVKKILMDFLKEKQTITTDTLAETK